MKYVALLRDSFCEAVDSKILYFTISLSLVVVVLLASLNFQPMTVEEQAQSMLGGINLLLKSEDQFSTDPSKCRLVTCVQLDKEKMIWQSDYKVVFELYLPPHVANSQKETFCRAVVYQSIVEQFWWMDNMKVKRETVSERNEIKGPIKNDKDSKQTPKKFRPNQSSRIRYVVTNKGTKIDDPRSWKHDPQLFFGLAPLSKVPWIGFALASTLRYSVFWIEYALVNNVGGTIVVLLGIIATAGFVPNMMQKGTIDLMLVKPISRPVLLLFKYFGGLFFIFLNSAVAIGGVWLVLGLRTGIWTYSFPIIVLILTFSFGVIYSVSTLFGVISRNPLVSILVTVIIWALLFGIGFAHYEVHSPSRGRAVFTEEGIKTTPAADSSESDSWQVALLNGAYTILPRTFDLGTVTTQLLSNELLSPAERRAFEFDKVRPVNIWATFGVSTAFIVLMLGLACFRFCIRDH